MQFKDFLLEQGVTADQADSIVKDMSENKFYLANEEHLDDRYTKLKGQNEQTNEDLKKANELIDQLQKDNKSVDDLQSQVNDYKTQIEQIGQQRIEDQKNNAIELALRDAGALNTKATSALLDQETLSYKDGQLTGFNDQLETIKQDNPFLFKSDEDPEKSPDPNIVLGGNPNPKNDGNDDPFAAKLAKYN